MAIEYVLETIDPASVGRTLSYLIDVVAAAVTFLEGTSAQRGILTHDGERILLQRLDDEPVVFDTAWREYALDADPAALDEIQRGRRQDTLLQPVLSEEDLETLRRRQEPS